MEKISLGVIFGGRSVEHEVSIISALQVINAINKEKYQVIPLYISKQGSWYTGEQLLDVKNFRQPDALLSNCDKVLFSQNNGDGEIVAVESKGVFKKTVKTKIDIAFLMLHGTHGEDGCVQGLLELAGIPYTGPGVLGSAIGMDKILMKDALIQAELPVVKFTWFYAWQWSANKAAIEAEINKLPWPVIVKPANLGSSIGISKVSNAQELDNAIELAANFSHRIIVEEAVNNLREINCSVLGCSEYMTASLCEEPVSQEDILSYETKYTSGSKGMSGTKRKLPAPISPELTATIQQLSQAAFTVLDGHGVCRIDFLLNDATQEVYINEINTLPGSLSFYLWEATGKSFTELTDDVIALGLQRYREKEKMMFSYSSNILSAFSGTKGGLKNSKA